MASNVNYKPLIFEKLEEFFEKRPDFNFCEVIHSVSTQMSRMGIKLEKKGDIFSVSDEDLYRGICRSLKDETINDEPIDKL